MIFINTVSTVWLRFKYAKQKDKSMLYSCDSIYKDQLLFNDKASRSSIDIPTYYDTPKKQIKCKD